MLLRARRAALVVVDLCTGEGYGTGGKSLHQFKTVLRCSSCGLQRRTSADSDGGHAGWRSRWWCRETPRRGKTFAWGERGGGRKRCRFRHWPCASSPFEKRDSTRIFQYEISFFALQTTQKMRARAQNPPPKALGRPGASRRAHYIETPIYRLRLATLGQNSYEANCCLARRATHNDRSKSTEFFSAI